MNISHRSLLGTAGAVAVAPRLARAQARPVIKIGSIADHSGPYRDNTGPTGVACAKLAAQEFNNMGFDVRTAQDIA